MIIIKLKFILCLVLAILLLGCNKVDQGNLKEINKNTDTIKEVKEGNLDITDKNIYGFDNRNRIEEIDKNGYFEDSAGYKFDKYIKSDHFELYYNSDNKSSKLNAEGSIEILENEYGSIIDFFGADENEIPIVKINMYEDYEQLRQVLIKELNYDINLLKSINIAGFAVKTNTFYYILRHDERNVDLKTLLVHEFTHNVTMALANKKRHDDWMWEGLAMYLAQDKDKYEPYYEDMINNGLPQIIKLRFYSLDRYKYGYSMVEYIIEEYGKEKLIELFKEYEDFGKVLNVTEVEFRDGWIKFLNNKIS